MPLLAPGHRTITPVNVAVAGGVTARYAAAAEGGAAATATAAL